MKTTQEIVDKFSSSDSEIDQAYARLVETGVIDVLSNWIVDEKRRDNGADIMFHPLSNIFITMIIAIIHQNIDESNIDKYVDLLMGSVSEHMKKLLHAFKMKDMETNQ